MAIIVNAKHRLKHRILSVSLKLTHAQANFLDSFTMSGKAGVKRKKYWLVNVEEFLKSPQHCRISQSFSNAIFHSRELLFSIVMIKNE